MSLAASPVLGSRGTVFGPRLTNNCLKRVCLDRVPLPGDDPRHGEVGAEMTRVWLITGAARGLGQAFTEAAIGAGDSVIATARTHEALGALVSSHGSAVFPLVLDVRDREAVKGAVAVGVEHFGKIDVLVNNAGYGLAGAVEELDEARVRAQFDVNFFGLLWCTQAVLPYMRAQGSGHIFQLSSLAGVNAPSNLGGYNSSKWAVEGISEPLAQEVESFGIKVTILEPGPFRSDWNGTSMERAEPMAAYDGVPRRTAQYVVRRRRSSPNQVTLLVRHRRCWRCSKASTHRSACCSASAPPIWLLRCTGIAWRNGRSGTLWLVGRISSLRPTPDI